MKVFLDGMPLLSPRTGVGNYVCNLFEEFKKFENIQTKLLYNGFKYHNTDEKVKVPIPYDFYRTILKNKYIYELFKLESFMGQFDIIHGTNFVTLPTKRAKQVVTIHDLSFIKYPEHVPYHILKHHSEWTKYSIEKSDAIIVDSESTANDLCTYYKTKESKINCIHLAASSQYKIREQEILLNVKSRYLLPDEFILYVGTVESRKNIISLLRSFKLAKDKYEITHKLVLAGGMGHRSDEIQKELVKLDLSNEVISLGYVKESDIPLIYNLSSLFIFISIYEGFGLPVLEAMQSGIPVIASNLSSIPEIVGDSSLLVDPFNISEIASKISLILQDSTARTEAIIKGTKQAEKFNWSKTASETIKVYNKLFEG